MAAPPSPFRSQRSDIVADAVHVLTSEFQNFDQSQFSPSSDEGGSEILFMEEEEEAESESAQVQFSPKANSSRKNRRRTRSLSFEDNSDNNDSDCDYDDDLYERQQMKLLRKRKRQCERWTEEEDQKLTTAVVVMGLTRWKKISEYVVTKDSDQCNQHWHRVLKPTINRAPWTSKEDSILNHSVRKHGESAWKKISSFLPGRTDTQCRHRWVVLSRAKSRHF